MTLPTFGAGVVVGTGSAVVSSEPAVTQTTSVSVTTTGAARAPAARARTVENLIVNDSIVYLQLWKRKVVSSEPDVGVCLHLIEKGKDYSMVRNEYTQSSG